MRWLAGKVAWYLMRLSPKAILSRPIKGEQNWYRDTAWFNLLWKIAFWSMKK